MTYRAQTPVYVCVGVWTAWMIKGRPQASLSTHSWSIRPQQTQSSQQYRYDLMLYYTFCQNTYLGRTWIDLTFLRKLGTFYSKKSKKWRILPLFLAVAKILFHSLIIWCTIVLFSRILSFYCFLFFMLFSPNQLKIQSPMLFSKTENTIKKQVIYQTFTFWLKEIIVI